MILFPSREAFSSGNCRRAATVARVMNGRYVSEKPYCAWNVGLLRSRVFATAVMSTRWTVVTCADVRFDITMCSAIRCRIVLSGSMRVLAGPAAGGAAGDGGGTAGAGAAGAVTAGRG